MNSRFSVYDTRINVSQSQIPSSPRTLVHVCEVRKREPAETISVSARPQKCNHNPLNTDHQTTHSSAPWFSKNSQAVDVNHWLIPLGMLLICNEK